MKLLILFLVIGLPLLAGAHPATEHRLALVEKQLEHDPARQSLHIERALLYSETGDYDTARSAFDKALSLGNPDRVMFALGTHYYRIKDLYRAKSAFDSYLNYQPNHPGALEYRAKVHRDHGDYAAALADFTTLLATAPYLNPGYFLTVAELHLQLDKNISAALSVIDDGIQQLGLVPQLQNAAIELEIKRGSIDAAIERQQSLIRLSESSPQTLLRMAELLQSANRPQQALKYAERAGSILASLRATPANRKLEQRAQQMASQLKREQRDTVVLSANIKSQ